MGSFSDDELRQHAATILQRATELEYGIDLEEEGKMAVIGKRQSNKEIAAQLRANVREILIKIGDIKE